MVYDGLRSIGWNAFFADQIVGQDPASSIVARVSSHHGTQVVLFGLEGEFRVPVQNADAAGRVSVGDWVQLEASDQRARLRFERRTILYRQAAGDGIEPQIVATNIDTAFIVSSCNDEFNLSRLERYLALAVQADIRPIVILAKADLHDDAASLRSQVESLHAGVEVLTADVREAEQIQPLRRWCGPGQSVALLGSSGVGKSTLATTLGAGELAVGEIRENDAKGRHTTTWRSLLQLPDGGVIVDNPGVREIQLPDCEDGLADVFDDILELATQCQFNDCSHQGDKGCAIQAAIDAGDLDPRRFANFERLRDEQAAKARRAADRRASDRKTGRMIKSALADKKRRRKAR
ncbi:MAG: ribosome small subunit-dependent GTPase A [Phycisphaerales bacterium]